MNIADYVSRMPLRRRNLFKSALTVTASTSVGSALMAACGTTTATTVNASSEGNFPTHPKWKFVFVNHVTTNAFFTPTQYGAADACALLGCSYQWTGSQTSSVPEMVTALNTAVSGSANGIALAVTSTTGFTSPVATALAAGIPVVSYNADGAVGDPGTARLAYIGQDLYVSGQQVGAQLATKMSAGATKAVGFIATPGQLNIQPRIDGATAALKLKGISVTSVATGATLTPESTAIPAWLAAHGSTVQGAFAVDGGSTSLLGPALAKYGLTSKVASGGFDLEPATLQAVKAGQLGFTIDQSPYLQGFLPVVYLY